MALTNLDDKVAADVRKQVEFYFGDSNLPRDKFLKLKLEESSDGLVELPLICTFAKMRHYLRLGNLPLEQIPEETVLAVAEVLRTSSLLKVSDDGKRVGRLTPLIKPEELIEQLDSRTIAVSPLEYDVRIEDIETYFSQYGKVNSIRLPRHIGDNKFFGGTALVEFCTEKDVNSVLGQKLVFSGAELELVLKKDYDRERTKLIEQLRNPKDSNPKNDRVDGVWFPKGVIIAFQLKKLSSETEENNGSAHQSDSLGPTSEDKVEGDVDTISSSKQAETEVSASEAIEKREETEALASEKIENEDGNVVGNDEPRDTVTLSTQEETETAANENVENKDKNCVGDAAPQEDNVVRREDLRELFKKFGTVKFVDYHIGKESGYIRFEEPEGSQKARAYAALADEGGLTLKGHLLILEPVTGDDEKKYWSFVKVYDKEKVALMGPGRGSGRGRLRGARGARGRGRGRESNGKRERDSGEAGENPPEKKLKA